MLICNNLLLSADPAILNTHLSQFAVEARKVNGQHYPPSTVYQLMSGLLRYMREANLADRAGEHTTARHFFDHPLIHGLHCQ